MTINIIPAPESAHLTHPKYRADIDGLRAIAVLSVVAFHAFPEWVSGGFIGVDIFFVISGFLISTIIFGDLERNSFSFTEFYSRRIKRIFPALLLVLIACYAIGSFVLFPGEYKQLSKHIAGGAGFIANFLFWNESGYFDNAAETKPLLHLWSLGIEEQFYIIWPLLLWFSWKRSFNLLAFTITITLISFVLNISTVQTNAVATFFGPHTRFWELLSGSLLAYIKLHKSNIYLKLGLETKPQKLLQIFGSKDNRKILCNILSMLGASLVGLGFLVIDKQKTFPGWWALLPVLGSVLIISAGNQAWLNRQVLSSRVLVWFGIISYPLYLWHWPLLSFVRIVEIEKPTLEIKALAVLTSIVLAWLTYTLVEKPIRVGKFRKYGNTPALVLLAIMLIVGSLGYERYQREYSNTGFTEDKGPNAPYEHEPFHNQFCDSMYPVFKKYNTCLLSKAEKPDVVIVGDSHSNHYYKSFAKALPDHSVMNLAKFSCLPFTSQPLQRNCIPGPNQALSFLMEEPSIKVIYVAGYWSYLASAKYKPNMEDGYRLAGPLTPENRLSFQQNGVAFLSALVASKKEIILMKDNPDLNFDIASCVSYYRLFTFKEQIKRTCGMDRSEYEKRIADSDTALHEILDKFPSIKVFDPKPIFCDGKSCRVMESEKSLYANGDHLSIYGADLVVKELLSQYPMQAR